MPSHTLTSAYIFLCKPDHRPWEFPVFKELTNDSVPCWHLPPEDHLPAKDRTHMLSDEDLEAAKKFIAVCYKDPPGGEIKFTQTTAQDEYRQGRTIVKEWVIDNYTHHWAIGKTLKGLLKQYEVNKLPSWLLAAGKDAKVSNLASPSSQSNTSTIRRCSTSAQACPGRGTRPR